MMVTKPELREAKSLKSNDDVTKFLLSFSNSILYNNQRRQHCCRPQRPTLELCSALDRYLLAVQSVSNPVSNWVKPNPVLIYIHLINALRASSRYRLLAFFAADVLSTNKTDCLALSLESSSSSAAQALHTKSTQQQYSHFPLLLQGNPGFLQPQKNKIYFRRPLDQNWEQRSFESGR